jgi:DNA-binding CsgD family transcriptional regulator
VQESRPAQIAVSGKRAVVIADHNGRIAFAMRQALDWLDKYFLPRRDPQRLPFVLRSWLDGPGRQNKPFEVEKLQGSLSVSLLAREGDGACCLLLKEIGSRTVERTVAQRLSAREAEVLYWVARGKSNSQIGVILNLKIATVKKHLQRIYPKLGVENRTAAAYFAAAPDGAD